VAALPDDGRAGPLGDDEADAAFGLFAGHRRFALAVSGGPDSLALLHLVAGWRARQAEPPDVHVFTLDHRLRPASEAESGHVAALCRVRGLPCRILRWEGEKPATGLQAAARAARQRLLGQAAAQARCSALVLAHHLDDQAETFLLRVARGSSLHGLAAMRAHSAWPRGDLPDLPVLRPLLGFAKARLIATCRAAGLAYAEDPSNDNPSYARARLRRAMPGLTEAGVTAARLAETAAVLARAAAVVDARIDAVLADACRQHPAGPLRLTLEALSDLPEAFRLRLLERLLGIVGTRGYPPRRERLERFAATLLAGEGRAQATLSGVVARREGRWLFLWREPGRQGIAGARHQGPGAFLWDGRFLLEIAGTAVVEVLTLACWRNSGGAKEAERLGILPPALPRDWPAAAFAAAPVLRLRAADGGALGLHFPGLGASAGGKDRGGGYVDLRPARSVLAAPGRAYATEVAEMPPELADT
jgi:tRNA(Ile)-lysidine synthase